MEKRAIVGFSNYTISNTGIVENIKTGLVLKQFRNVYGYPGVKLSNLGIMKSLNIHRLVGIAFIEPIVGSNQINHIDGNKENNNVENLEWVSSRENHLKAYALGLNDNKRRRVMNTKTGEIFLSARDASRAIGLSNTAVSTSIYSGLAAGGIVWTFIDEDDKPVEYVKKRLGHGKKVLLEETGEIFESAAFVSRSYGDYNTSLNAAIFNGRKYHGKNYRFLTDAELLERGELYTPEEK